MTAQTPLGLTYPQPGDHTRLWEHFQTLADDVDDALARQSGASNYVSYWRFGPLCGLEFIAQGQPGTTVGTVPAALRPNEDLVCVGYIYTSSGTAQADSALPFRIRSNGAVFTDAPSGLQTPSGGSMRGSAVWFADKP